MASLLEGWLECKRRSNLIKKFRPVYVKLYPDKLEFFAKESDEKPKETAPLQHGVNGEAILFKKAKPPRRAILVGKEVYICSSEEERMKWLTAIRQRHDSNDKEPLKHSADMAPVIEDEPPGRADSDDEDTADLAAAQAALEKSEKKEAKLQREKEKAKAEERARKAAEEAEAEQDANEAEKANAVAERKKQEEEEQQAIADVEKELQLAADATKKADEVKAKKKAKAKPYRKPEPLPFCSELSSLKDVKPSAYERRKAPPHKKAIVRKRIRGEVANIRLFISSTFVDTHEERDVLIKKVIPALNKELAERDVQITPVDLRWGVSADESTSQTIQRTCLDEIDRCRAAPNEAPWFLGLRTERYGWVQEKINNPSDFENPERFAWTKRVEKEHPAGVSITSLEVWHAVLGCESFEGAPHAFFAFRDPSFIKTKVDDSWKWVFDFEYRDENDTVTTSPLQYTKTPKCAQYKKDFETIQKQIKAAKDRCSYFEYSPTGDVVTKQTGELPSGKRFGTGSVKGLDEFANQVYSMLFNALDAEYPVYTTELRPEDNSDVQHELRARSLLSCFTGRKSDLNTLEKYVRGNKGQAMVLSGPTGTGKSATLAKLCKDLETDKNTIVIKHFIGAEPLSFDLMATFVRLSTHLKGSLVSGINKPVPEDSVGELKGYWMKLIGFANQGRKDKKSRILIVLDGVDKLEENAQKTLRSWVPKDLGQHVRIIISSSDTSVLAGLLEKSSLHTLGGLSKTESKTIVREYLGLFHKKLSEDATNELLGDQMALLMAKKESTLPLYLLATATDLVSFGVYEQVTKQIKRLPETFAELFVFVLNRLEEEHGCEFVTLTFSLIAASFKGITEANLVQILESFDYKDERVSNFSRLFNSIKLYVTAGGTGTLRIVFGSVQKLVEERYMSTPAAKSRIHDIMQSFYHIRADPKLDYSWDSPDAVSDYLEALPFHLYHARGPELAAKLLTDGEFLRSKAELCSPKAIMADLLMDGLGDLCYTIYVAIRRLATVVENEPSQLTMQLAGMFFTLAQYNDAVNQFVSSCRHACVELYPVNTNARDQILSLESKPSPKDDTMVSNMGMTKPPKNGLISTVAHSGAVNGLAATVDGGIAVAASMGVSASLLDMNERSVFAKISLMMFYSISTAITPDVRHIVMVSGGMALAAGSTDMKPEIRVHDTISGQQLRVTAVQDTKSTGQVCATNTQIIVACYSGSINVYNLETLKLQQQHKFHNCPVTACQVVGGTHVLSGDAHNNLILWELSTGKILHRREGVFDFDSSYKYSGWEGACSGRISVSASGKIVGAIGNSHLHVFALPDMKEICAADLEEGFYSDGFAVLSDDAHIAYTTGGTIKIFSIAKKTVVKTYDAHSASISKLVATNNMCVVSGSDDQSVKIHGISVDDMGASDEVDDLKPEDDRHETAAAALEAVPVVVPDSDTVVTVDRESVKVWNALTGEAERILDINSGCWLSCATFSHDAKTLVFGGRSGEVHWVHNPLQGGTETTKAAWDNRENTTVQALLALPTGSVVSGHKSGKIRFWDLKQSDHIKEIQAHPTEIFSLSLAHTGKRFLSASASLIKFYSFEGEATQELNTASWSYPKGLYLGPNDDYIILTNGNNIQTFMLENGKFPKTPEIMKRKTDDSVYIADAALVGKKKNKFLTLCGVQANVFSAPEMTPLLSFVVSDAKQIATSGDVVVIAGLRVSLLHVSDHKAEVAPRWMNKKDPYKTELSKKGEKTIATKTDLASRDVDLRTASFEGKVADVKRLLADGANPKAADLEYGYTALHSAASAKTNSEAIIKLLVKAGADIRAKEKLCGNTPLQTACQVGIKEAVKALLALGADINEASNTGTTPVVSAVSCCKYEIASWLLDQGADPFGTTNGCTMMDLMKNVESNWESGAMLEFKKDGLKLIQKLKKLGVKSLQMR